MPLCARKCAISVVDCVKLLLQISQRNLFELSVSLFFLNVRAILECEEFQEAMSAPLGVTNTFIMLKKSDRNSVSDYFLPKPQYTPPTETTRLDCFKIKLCHDNQVDIPCTCRTLIKIYHDSCKTDSENETDVQCSQYNGSTQSLYQWYQSKQVIRGFKFYS
ncbi:hypothetical protein X777_14277 [Ooceraea biroi]|uniref:Uncharacterized protein n=1 Tax=Ooceraea biroi TaxID=2015173 RepID=A0A026WY65_OOCBI|nr:hypothetical protein X777_14277 [Ooceraea biroi]